MSALSVEALLAEAGPLDESIEQIVESEALPGKAWAMSRDGQWIFLEQLEDTDLLFLRAPMEIPRPPQGEVPAQFYAFLLRYSTLCSQNGGFSMGLDEDGADAQLMMPVNLTALTAQEFVRQLRVFAERLAVWQQEISKLVQAPSEESRGSVWEGFQGPGGLGMQV